MADTPDKDLLGFKRSATDVGNPDQYLKVEDFVSTPKTTDTEYYPSINPSTERGQSMRFGEYGGGTIYSGAGALPPYSIVDARAKAFQHAAMAEQMRSEYRKQQRLDVAYNRPSDLPLAYNEDYQRVGKDASMQMYSDAVKYYGGNQSKAAQDLQNPNGIFGRKYRDFITNYQTYGSNVDEMSKMTDAIRKQQVENKIIVPDSMEKTLQDFEGGGFGKLDEHDPTDLKQKFIQMKVMNNMLPAYNAFVKELTPKEVPGEKIGKFKGRAGYSTVAIDPEVAKEEALKVVSGGQKTAWALTLGLPADASTDEIATALGESAVNKRDVQYKPLPEHAGGEGARDYANQKPGEYNVPVNFVMTDAKGNQTPTQQTFKYHRSITTKKDIPVTNTGDVYDATTGRELKDAPTTFSITPAANVLFTVTKNGQERDILATMGTMKEYSQKDYEQVKLDLWRKNLENTYGKYATSYTDLSSTEGKKTEPDDSEINAALKQSGKLTHEKTVLIPLSHVKGALEQEKINTGVDEKAVQHLPGQKSSGQHLSETDWNAGWAKLKSGESMVGLDGKTYTKK